MAKKVVAEKAVAQITGAIPHLIRLPVGKVWIDYDQEADVLYVSLKRPQKATDTQLLARKGVLVRYRGKELVGVTILDASKRRKGRKKATNTGRRARHR
ncbi:MAG: DUF2283 domain-containing protein [Candidatus Zixiibacteriota bacterium]